MRAGAPVKDKDIKIYRWFKKSSHASPGFAFSPHCTNYRPEMLTRKSRSLEHILDNTSSSSSGAGSSYTELVSGLTTLPRLRRCDEVPGMWRAAYNYTDTMRSAKSVTSIKSVQVSHNTFCNPFSFRWSSLPFSKLFLPFKTFFWWS